MFRKLAATALLSGVLLTAAPLANAAPIDRTPPPVQTVWCPPWCKAMPYLSYLCPQPRVCER